MSGGAHSPTLADLASEDGQQLHHDALLLLDAGHLLQTVVKKELLEAQDVINYQPSSHDTQVLSNEHNVDTLIFY